MINDEFLEAFIKHTDFLVTAMPEQMVTVKDIAGIHRYCSPFWAEKMGIDPHDVIGIELYLPMYGSIEMFRAQIRAEDQAAMQRQETIVTLKVHELDGVLHPYFCSKTPINNPDTGDCVGVYAYGVMRGDISFEHILRAYRKDIKPDGEIPHLTPREKQVVFLFLANLSSKKIAKIIGEIEGKTISKSTIDSVFNDQLYGKFDVYNRQDLCKKLLGLGFSSRVPKEFLCRRSIILNGTQVY